MRATAAAKLAVSKNTNDGGAVYVIGNNVIFNITARCNPGGSTGNLFLTSGSLVDSLPAGLTFVSATPAATSDPGVGNSGAITWNYPDAASLPAGCSANGAGTTNYTVVARLDTGVPNDAVLTNGVTLSGTPMGTNQPLSTSAEPEDHRDRHLPGQRRQLPRQDLPGPAGRSQLRVRGHLRGQLDHPDQPAPEL